MFLRSISMTIYVLLISYCLLVIFAIKTPKAMTLLLGSNLYAVACVNELSMVYSSRLINDESIKFVVIP